MSVVVGGGRDALPSLECSIGQPKNGLIEFSMSESAHLGPDSTGGAKYPT